MTLRNQLKNVKIQNVETIQSYFTRVSQIKEQMEAVDEEIENENIEGADKCRASKYRISLVLEENELDSYINEEVPVPEGNEAKALHKKKLVMEKRIIADSIKD